MSSTTTSLQPVPVEPIVTATFEVETDLAKEFDLLSRFEKDAQAAGLIGEQTNAKVVLLAAASAGLETPLNVTVAGSSSAGKNQLIGTVALFLPDSRKKFLTGMSPKVMMYSAEDEYEHKAVFVAEHEGVAGADYAIRTMQSERLIEYEFVNPNTLKKEKRRVKGPVAFIEATTRSVLHPENETRLLFLRMDESEGQTRAIIARQAKDANTGRQPKGDFFKEWHKLFESLKDNKVRIPFAEQLADFFPATKVRSRRDFPKLLALIEASAYLHQHQRKRDGEGYIVASAFDYHVAKRLFEHCYGEGPEKSIDELLKIAEQCKEEFPVAYIMEKTGWGQTKAYELLKRTQELGCIGEGERRGRYRFLRKLTEASLKLPSKIKLTAHQMKQMQ